MISFTRIVTDQTTICEIRTIRCKRREFNRQVNNNLQAGWLFYSNIVYESEGPNKYDEYNVIMFKTSK